MRKILWLLWAAPLFSQSQGFRIDAVAVSPSQPVHTDSFLLEAASESPVTVAATSTRPGIALTVITPAGETINAQNVESLGGSHFEADLTGMRDSLLPFLPGHRVQLEFPQRGVGRYTIRVDGAALTEEAAVVLELPFLSLMSVSAGQILPDVAAGESVPLSIEVKESGEPLLGASAFAEISRNGEPNQVVTLKDDGAAPDERAGDGVYVGSYSPTGPGDYAVTVWALGQRANGEAFRQGSSQKFTVHPLYAQFTGAHQDRGVDEDGDGRFDRVDLTFDVEVTKPGVYDLIAELRSKAGASYHARGRGQSLQAGRQAMVAPIPLKDIHRLGGPGPYTIAEATLTWAPSGVERIRAHRLADLGQTHAYALADLNPFPASYRSFTESAADTDHDGTFDELIVEVVVDVAQRGVYDSTMGLTSAAGQPVAVAAGPQVLRGGAEARNLGLAPERTAEIIAIARERKYLETGAQKLTARFFGPDIRRAGVDGPYAIRLTLSKKGDEAPIGEIGKTRGYRAEEFDGLTPRITEVDPPLLQPGEERHILIVVKEKRFDSFGEPPAVSAGEGVTVTAVKVLTFERLSARLKVDRNAALGSRDVIVTSPEGSFTAPGALTLARPARILSITPREAERGETLEVAIEAENTSFAQGVTQVELAVRFSPGGTGIDVRNLRVLDADSLQATLVVGQRAATGYLDIVATTGAETTTFDERDEARLLVFDHPKLGYVSPLHVRRGESLSIAIGVNRIDLQSGPLSLDFGKGIVVQSTEAKGDRVTAQVAVAPDAPLGQRPISLQTNTGKWTTDQNELTVLPAPRGLSVTPSSAAPGESVVVTILMEGALFVQGWETKVTAGEGIYVRDLEVPSPTEIKARFTVDPMAAPGPRTIQLTGERDKMALEGAFTVAPRP